jgi:tetratricopeptide (TPR) repeat protein
MRTSAVVLASLFLGLFLAPAASAASSRITFDRTLAAAQSLGTAKDVAIVNAPANDPLVDVFVDELMHRANRSGALLLRDARHTTGPADAHLEVKMFRCATETREAEGGKQQRTIQAAAICTARVEVLSRFLKPLSTFFAKGEGTSPRTDTITDEERNRALLAAARYAAIDAAERITPRRVRESVALDESAPAFAEGMAMIEANRFAEARAIWTRALQTQPRSAALRFNLAAINEAMGDRRAAEVHYNAARQLAPKEPRYASELKRFARRGLP